jgi:hypothetical protein
MNIFKLYSSVLKPKNINLYSSVLSENRRIYGGADLMVWARLNFRWLTDEYRRVTNENIGGIWKWTCFLFLRTRVKFFIPLLSRDSA